MPAALSARPDPRWDQCGRCAHYRLEHVAARGAGRRCLFQNPDTDARTPCDCLGWRPRTNASPRRTS